MQNHDTRTVRLVRKDNPEIAIIGTLEIVSGCAGIAGASRSSDGSLDIDWEGGTEIYWDEQRTQVDGNGARLYVDEEGATVHEDNVLLDSEVAR